MAYTKKTVVKCKRTLFDLVQVFVAMLLSGIDLHVAISNGNRKIGRVMNVSIAPLLTCGNCSKCASYCYDIKACLQYENVRKARAKNTAILQVNREKYFTEIRQKIARRKLHKYFRWHVAGDIPDIAYLDEMIAIARENPTFTFWTYTKMYGIVNNWCKQHGVENIPSNLHIMFSEWRGMPLNNPYNFPVFTVRFISQGEKFLDNVWICPGNCDICKEQNRGCVAGETSQVADH